MSLEEYLRKRYRPETVGVYLREIRAYQGGVVDAAGASYQDVIAYLGRLRERYPNPSTLNRILAAIKVYHRYLVVSGHRSDDPARAIELRDKRSRDVQLQDLFTREELELLMERKERYTRLALRNRVLVSLLIYQALTPTELEQLTTGCFDMGRGVLEAGPTERTNARELRLRPQQVMLVHEYLEGARPRLLGGGESERLLIGTRGNPLAKEDITKYVRRKYADLFPERRLNATTIRQSVIAELLKEGHDLRVVQAFAGHKYPSTTEKYRGSDVELLRAELERYHPMG